SDSRPEEKAHEMLDYYVNDRVEHLGLEIIPAMNKGKIVLCDRYKYSTIVYQFAQGLPLVKLIRLHEKMLIPDLVLIFDVPSEIALERIVKDKKRDLIEKFEKKDFLDRVRNKFLDLPNFLLGENIKIIDASKSIDEVFEETKNEIDKLLKLP
ncbi:MAG: dTMP kinase, partial [Candidatus Diapherotrites archaeon]